MVSAKPKRPKGPLVNVSWSRPIRKPTSIADSELPPNPCSTTTIRKTSTARLKLEIVCWPARWTSTATTTARRSLRAPIRLGLQQALRHRRALQEVDLVEGAEVHRRRHRDVVEELPSLLDRDHRA